MVRRKALADVSNVKRNSPSNAMCDGPKLMYVVILTSSRSLFSITFLLCWGAIEEFLILHFLIN